jgi:hypothetical protein
VGNDADQKLEHLAAVVDEMGDTEFGTVSRLVGPSEARTRGICLLRVVGEDQLHVAILTDARGTTSLSDSRILLRIRRDIWDLTASHTAEHAQLPAA